MAFYRGLIDEVDAELGHLLNRRVALTHAVQPHKPAAERDPGRESEIVEAMARRAPALGADRLSRIVHAVITESLDAATE
jgi:chorismate mutase